MRDMKTSDHCGGKPGTRQVVWLERPGFASFLACLIDQTKATIPTISI